MAKNKKIEVIGREISLYSEKSDDYISLTDMARYRDSERTNYIIQNWMRTRSAIEFCGLWEQMNNPDFKRIEFDAFKNESGANSFTLTPQKWIETTNAIGIISKSGRYGGTFAHRDIAFEFATWISADLFSKDAIERIIEARTRYYQHDISQKERQAIADEIIDVLDVAFLSFFFQIKDIPEHTDPPNGQYLLEKSSYEQLPFRQILTPF
jgi:hypothetical protein